MLIWTFEDKLMTRVAPQSAASAIKAFAHAHGFDACAITSATAPWQAGTHLQAFIAQGHHGTMDWMETTQERRSHPKSMWAEAKSAIMLGFNYGPDTDPLEALKSKSTGNISVYARGDDYHDVIKKRLKALAGDIHRTLNTEVKVFVDTAPLMEKPLAARAGLGWQGKHTNLVSREFGSFLFLGCILTAHELTEDKPEIDHCGSCTACLDICPTNAFPAPYQLDARRCISYLTIEHAGPIPEEFRAAMGNRIYGCDDCLAVCPWNKFASLANEAKLQARSELVAPPLSDLARLDDASFRALFAKNPVKRIGVSRFLRNVAIAIGNCGEAALVDAAHHLAKHDEAIVRGGGIWALKQLLNEGEFAALAAARKPAEADPVAAQEWGSPS
jgi:epoxyqueuosine reductase